MYNEYINALRMFDDIEVQMSYLDKFFDDYNVINKTIKKEIRERIKKSKMEDKKTANPRKKRGRKKERSCR